MDRKTAIFGVVLVMGGAVCGGLAYRASGDLAALDAKYESDHPALRGDLSATVPSQEEDSDHLSKHMELGAAYQRWMIGACVVGGVGVVVILAGLVGTGGGKGKTG